VEAEESALRKLEKFLDAGSATRETALVSVRSAPRLDAGMMTPS